MNTSGTGQAEAGTVYTVLGPVSADDLGVVAVHEALLSVLPGAQYAPDIRIDRAEVFEILSKRLREFREHGGGTIVDSAGMFHGRDLSLYEALARTTGVHLVASTGMGPEELLGGYFLTPQTNPPTPWPADRFADLFTKEVTQGMVVPRLERRASAGLVTSTASREGMTSTEESLFRAAARTATATGVPVSIRYGADALHDLEVVLTEQVDPNRVLVGGLDRTDAVEAGAHLAVAGRGVFLGIDHVGAHDDEHLDDRRRAALVAELFEAGHAERLILSCNAVGVAKGHEGTERSYSFLLTDFVPLLHERGLTERDVRQILVDNPRNLLTVR